MSDESVNLEGLETLAPGVCVAGGWGPAWASPGVTFVRPAVHDLSSLVAALARSNISPDQVRLIEWPSSKEAYLDSADRIIRHAVGTEFRGLPGGRWFPFNDGRGIIELAPPADPKVSAFARHMGRINVEVVVGYVALPLISDSLNKR